MFPAEPTAPACYGPALRAYVCYLVTRQHIAIARVAELLADTYGAPVSTGTIISMVREGAAMLDGFLAQVKDLLAGSGVVHADETGLRVQARLRWVHSASSPDLTLYHLDAKRGTAAMAAMGVLEHLRGVLVHDGWVPYRHYDQVTHARCNAHHLRELDAVAENDAQGWAKDMAGLLADTWQIVRTAKAEGRSALADDDLDRIRGKYRAIIAAGHAANPPPVPTGLRGRPKRSKAANLVLRLDLYAQDVLRFATDFAVPFDNYAELDIATTTPPSETSRWSRSPRRSPAASVASKVPRRSSPSGATSPRPPNKASTFTTHHNDSSPGTHGCQQIQAPTPEPLALASPPPPTAPHEPASLTRAHPTSHQDLNSYNLFNIDVDQGIDGMETNMAHDLVIRGGSVVDGTGADRATADVAIDDGRITVVGKVEERGEREIDADGALVTPGWVDIHSHYDGQATWDEELAPSSWHGVTTLVTGNCGVGFAPARPDSHDWLIGLMEGVEDIPGSALAEGLTWDWETFPEYLDSLDKRRWTVDIGTQIAHGAVRAYVMGGRGARNEPATPDDIAAMAEIVKEAVQAGALGFSTSRTIAHRAIDGEPVPGTYAAEDELFGIGAVLGELGAGVFELAPTGVAGEDIVAPMQEMAWMRRLAKTVGRPVTFAMLQVDAAPELWREMLDESAIAAESGVQLVPQVAGRPTGLLSGFETTYSFLDAIPAYQDLAGMPLAEKLERLRSAEGRRAVLGWVPDEATSAQLTHAAEHTYLLGDPPDYEPGPEATLAAMAAVNGRSVVAVALDAMLADDGRGLLYLPILNYSDGNSDSTREMILHPAAVLGLADGGAHVGTICDASMPTWMLTHWVRDRTRGERLPLEFVVARQTRDTARLYGLGDRGTLEPGMVGDVNVIDFDHLRLETPRIHADLPAGGRRLLQRAHGYLATVKSGTVTFGDGVPTGDRPGRLLRGGR